MGLYLIIEYIKKIYNMSYTETHIGKLVKISVPDDFESWLTEKGIDVEEKSTYDNYTIYVDSEHKPKYIFINSELVFEVLDTSSLDEDYIDNLVKINNNEYHYVFRFYNGGTYFEEMLTDAIDRIKF